MRHKIKEVPGQICLFDIIMLVELSGADPKKKSKTKEPKIIPQIEGKLPKATKAKIEKYVNVPYNMSLIDAFRKAASECKNPSRELKTAIEKDNFILYIPSAYRDDTMKYRKNNPSQYSFVRYIGQKVKHRDGNTYKIKRIAGYYTVYDGKGKDRGHEMCCGPVDIHPADKNENIDSLKVELEYQLYQKKVYEYIEDSGFLETTNNNIGAIKKELNALGVNTEA